MPSRRGMSRHALFFLVWSMVSALLVSLGVIGKGISVWSHVHIEDLACLYMRIFDAAICSCRLYTGRNGMYFANGECKVREIFEAVAKELGARGLPRGRPTVFAQEEMEKYTYTFTRIMGSNARARGEYARSIGWKPVHDMRIMLDAMKWLDGHNGSKSLTEQS